jgi:hypothetical protein
MRCPPESDLEEYLANELTARAFGLVDKHVHDCEACRVVLEELQLGLQLLRDALAPPAAEHLVESVLRRLRSGD